MNCKICHREIGNTRESAWAHVKAYHKNDELDDIIDGALIGGIVSSVTGGSILEGAILGGIAGEILSDDDNETDYV